MKIYDTNYGPDTFGRIRMGIIKEMFLTFEGYLKPEVDDQLRISCIYKGIVRDVYTVTITSVSDCIDEIDTVLIKIEYCDQKSIKYNQLLDIEEMSANPEGKSLSVFNKTLH